MSITVGQVSGIIAAAVAIVQLLFPNALVLIIVSILGNEHNAVTWAVASRHILSSAWPLLVRSDTAAGSSVNIGVRLLGAIKFFGVLLIAIAAVVTPLGLYESIIATKSDVEVPFSDLVDTSPIGIGTPARSSLGFSRACGNWQPLVCPGSKTQVDLEFDPDDPTMVINSTIIGTYDVNVPEALISRYQSGLSTQPETVSSFFDIQTRQYTEVRDPKKINGEPFQVDAFRMLEPMVLNNAVEAREGVIVDTEKGRVGFRHHRTPNNVGAGAEWEEDLLFLEPDTQCVDLNLTIEFKIPKDGSLLSNLENLTLIDNGGFSNLVQKYPTMNVTTTQEDPQLRFRAYKAAWLTTVYSMLIMNVTRPSPNSFAYLNSEPGKRFPLYSSGFSTPGTVNSIKSDTIYNSLVSPDSQVKTTTNSSFTNETYTTGLYDNPFNITNANYTSISMLCQGAGGADLANSSNIWIQCGLIYGAARRADGKESLVFRPGDLYHQSVYSCASVTKASIKTVSLKFNATAGENNVKALTITNITDKVYSDNDGPNPPPLWGIETLDMGLVEVQQLWGLISEENKDAENLTAIRAPHLHLPGYNLGTPPTAGLAGYQFIPASTAITKALVAIYDLNPTFGYDYSGESNLALFQKWQSLSKDADSVGKMLNIIWADIAANYMTGTRGWGTGKNVTAGGSGLQKRQSSSSSNDNRDDTAQTTVMVPVKLYERKVQFHWLYAIPAFMALLLFGSVMALSCCCMVFRGGPKRTRYYLNHLSAGRLLGEQRFPGTVDKQVPTKVWIKAVGKHTVALRDGVGFGPGATSPAAGGDGFYREEGKPGLVNASATELHRLNPAGNQSPTNAQGYMRVQS